MHCDYADIRDKLGEPVWWDECGVPRYCEFAPDKAANIYWRECALLAIACQNCGQEFAVCMTWASLDMAKGTPSLGERLKSGELDYGDPPNVRCCPAGPTMMSETLGVVEFWQQGDGEPERVGELEGKAEGLAAGPVWV